MAFSSELILPASGARVTKGKRLIDILYQREAMAPETPGKIRRSPAVRFRGLQTGPHFEEV
jgi:hypothetical protein